MWTRPAVCRLCECPASDGGVRVARLDFTKLSNWWRRTIDSQFEFEAEPSHEEIFCHFCVWDAKLEMECSADELKRGPACDWWSGHDSNKFFHDHYYQEQSMRACRVELGSAETVTIFDIDEPAADESTNNIERGEQPFANQFYELSSTRLPAKKRKLKQLDQKHFLSIEEEKSDDEDSEPDYKVHRKSSRRHQCFWCSRAFDVRSKFTEHLHTQHAGRFFECKHGGWCSKLFRTNEEKTKHQQLEHNKSEFKKCDFCHRTYPRTKMSMHLMEYHAAENLVRCSYRQCATYFRSEELKSKHIELVHAAKERELKCIFCGIFMFSGSMRRHLKNKHKAQLPNAFKCTFHCLHYFHTKEDRKEHMNSFHKIPALQRMHFKCVYCSQVYPCKKGMRNHISRSHPDQKIQCKFHGCARYFHTQAKYQVHLDKVHLPEEQQKRFQCAECTHRTDCKNNFRTHWLKMHENNNIPCPKCDKKWNSSLALKSHLQRSHSDPKLCVHCNTKFVHLREHQTKSKCYKCRRELLCNQSALLHTKDCN